MLPWYFLIPTTMGGHKSYWNQLTYVPCLCTCDLFLVCSSFDSCVIIWFACRIVLNISRQPTKHFCTMHLVLIFCATFSNNSPSCFKKLWCSYLVMGLNNLVNVLCCFCCRYLDIPNYHNNQFSFFNIFAPQHRKLLN